MAGLEAGALLAAVVDDEAVGYFSVSPDVGEAVDVVVAAGIAEADDPVSVRSSTAGPDEAAVEKSDASVPEDFVNGLAASALRTGFE